jgi:hypothetical protein
MAPNPSLGKAIRLANLGARLVMVSIDSPNGKVEFHCRVEDFQRDWSRHRIGLLLPLLATKSHDLRA